jgi:hypothetical protein
MRSGVKNSVSKSLRCAFGLTSRSGFTLLVLSTGEVRQDVEMSGLGTEGELRLRIKWVKTAGQGTGSRESTGNDSAILDLVTGLASSPTCRFKSRGNRVFRFAGSFSGRNKHSLSLRATARQVLNVPLRVRQSGNKEASSLDGMVSVEGNSTT